MSITYSECGFVALVIQHTKRARFIISSSVAWLALPCFSTLSQMAPISKKKKLIKMRVSIFSTTYSGTFLILRRTDRDMIINVYWS